MSAAGRDVKGGWCLSYNDRNAGTIPAHTGSCVHRKNPGAIFRRRFHGRAADMVTYSDLFQFVTMLCAIITLVIYFERKK